ncbi:unnamed protein product [Diamesa serratosioi]
MDKILIAFTIVIIYEVICVFGRLPSLIEKCPRSTENMNLCITNSIEHLRPSFAIGDMGENFTIPKIEPLFIDEIKMQRGKDFKATFKNLLVSGPSNFILKNMKANIDNKTFNFELGLPLLDFTGDYSLNIKIILFEIKGKGTLSGKFKNSFAKVQTIGFTENIDGIEYVRFRLTVKLKIDYAFFHMDNLFNGDSILNDLASSIHVCSRNDPELVKCVINSVTHLRPKLADGRIADDFILPALEPLTLDNIKMERGREFKATFSKLSVKGPSNFIIDKLRINLENTTFDLLLTLPKLDFVGKYDLRMKILVLDIVGNGDMQGAFENTRGRVRMPSTIHVCSRNDPDLPKCILNSVAHLQPRLASGIFSDDFIVPALEPLILETIKMERGRDFKATFSKISVKGPSNFIIEKLKMNLQNTTFEIIISLPRLEFTGKYNIKIRVLVVEFNGNGDMKGVFEKSKARVRMRARKYQKNGQTYMKFDTFNIKIQPGTQQVLLTNLFKGNKNLEEIGNRFINENTQLFINEVVPGLEQNLAEIFTKTANEIVASASLDELFPEVAPIYD